MMTSEDLTGLVCYKHNQEGMLLGYLLDLMVFHESDQTGGCSV